MSRKPLALAAALSVASLAIASPALAHPTATPLVGTDGPGFTITLTNGGKAVKSLKPGSYMVSVNDKASVHNFHLFGPGVNKVITSVPFVGKKSVSVTLKKGTYTFQCDVHAASGMKGTFKVT
jgi:Copper binding proteins, plastocyanin/azurin family